MKKISITIEIAIDLDDTEKAATLAEQLVENAIGDWADCPRFCYADIRDIEDMEE